MRTLKEKRAFARKLRQAPTPAEETLYPEIMRKRLGVKFRTQSVIGGYIVDFYCPSHNLVIEIDGSVHAKRVDYDKRRDARLKSFGLTVLHFKNEEIYFDTGRVVERIKKQLALPVRKPFAYRKSLFSPKRSEQA